MTIKHLVIWKMKLCFLFINHSIIYFMYMGKFCLYICLMPGAHDSHRGCWSALGLESQMVLSYHVGPRN